MDNGSCCVTANQVLERYVGAFSNKIRRHLEDRKIDPSENLLSHLPSSR